MMRLAASLQGVAVLFGGLFLIAAAGFLSGSFAAGDEMLRAFWLGAFAIAIGGGIVLLGLYKLAVRADARREARARRDTQAALGALLDAVPALVNAKDSEGRYLFLNRYQARLLGTEAGRAIGRTDRELAHADRAAVTAARERRVIESGEPLAGIEERLRTADGEERVVVTTLVPLPGPDGEVGGVGTVSLDVTEARSLADALAHQSRHDALTGLANRAELERRLARLAGTEGEDADAHALCVVALDRFKVVNDLCGHAGGDALLRAVAGLLRERVRRHDTVARIGADEFAVVMDHCGSEKAVALAEALRSAVERHRFACGEQTFGVTASVGVVAFRGGGHDVADLLRAAGGACRSAKEQGGNRVRVYEPDDRELARHRDEARAVARVRRALEEDRLRLWVQAIVPTGEADPAGDRYELLLRLEDDDGTVIPAGEFLPAAERYGLAVAIDRWVLERALAWLESSPARVERLALCSINLSGHSLIDEDFERFACDRLRAAGVPPGRLCFEITETAAITSYARARRFIQALKALGCRFALDDFGSGLSSFAYLKNLPVDFLKIDGVLVRDVADDPVGQAMVRSIHELGKAMGTATIAEFAEDERTVECLRGLGVEFAQGYALGRPQPAEGWGAAH